MSFTRVLPPGFLCSSISVSFLVLVHLTFFLARGIRPFSWRVHTSLFVCDLICHRCHFFRSSHMLVSDFAFLLDSTHLLQPSRLIHLQSHVLAFCCCPCICTIVLYIFPSSFKVIFLSHNTLGAIKVYVTLFSWKLDPIHLLVTLITLNFTPSRRFLLEK